MKKKILITPLNWGIGHAARCIPIITLLLQQDAEVMIASDGAALLLLKEEFPALHFFELPSYNPIYPTDGKMVLKMATQLPKFIRAITQENEVIAKLVKQYKIDIIISDNRYGCFAKGAKNIFMSHQCTILMPEGATVLEKIVNYFNAEQTGKFDTFWLPDFDDERKISGKLSEGEHNDKQFIGQLSRLNKIASVEKKYNIIVVLSGPEPQRTILEEIITKQLANYDDKALLVKGKPEGTQDIKQNENVDTVDFLNSKNLNLALKQSDVVIARSGYSTIMDVAKLGMKAIFIPTPGQTEQQYLAENLMEKGMAFQMNQTDFNLTKAIRESEQYQGFSGMNYENELLEKIVIDLLK